MAYSVNLTARAELDLAILYGRIDAENSEPAMRWFKGLFRAIFRLQRMPNRSPETAEDPHLRNLLYGRKPHVYRVIYCVFETNKQVEVLHIRHAAMGRFRVSDLK
jgi:plasmid stabilization system protein ParE